MSVQGDIETAIAGHLSDAITGGTNYTLGPISQPRVEGVARWASVRATIGDSDRLEYGQSGITEAYGIVVWWRTKAVTREASMTEWEAFRTLVLEDPTLVGSNVSIVDAWVGATQWAEGEESQFRTMTAELIVSRIE